MLEGVLHMLKRNHDKRFKAFVILLVLSAAASIYFFLQPAASTVQVNDNQSQMETRYDYKAEMMPNILYPDGGTVEAGNTIFNKISVSIPFNLTSTIQSQKQVSAKGTHEVQLLIKAENFWERTFPLEEKQAFEQTGTDISIIDQPYKIDLEQVKSFILRVEEETGIRPAQYTLEIMPNIQGTILDSGAEKPFQLQDKLVFQYSFEEIVLASEKEFTSTTASTSSQVIPNTLHVIGMDISISFLRVSSLIFSILLLASIIYLYKNSRIHPSAAYTSEIDSINKRYSNRIIPVSQKINIVQKSIFVLDSFQSILKIADDKELPIFFSKDQKEDTGVYFIVDGNYLYTYDVNKMNELHDAENEVRSDKVYAKGY